MGANSNLQIPSMGSQGTLKQYTLISSCTGLLLDEDQNSSKDPLPGNTRQRLGTYRLWPEACGWDDAGYYGCISPLSMPTCLVPS